MKYCLDEDFGMGVGAPLGADQGIPYGGDGKAVAPCYMGIAYRPMTAQDYLKPIKSKRRRRRRRLY